MSELTTGGINFEYPFAYRIDKEAIEEHDKAIRKSFEKAFAIAELEKIKEEMNVELFKEYSAEREFDSGYESCLKQQIDRIDNHIKELKGNQK